jgi:multicomponent Na+:H+ antiporter subunit F
MQTWHVALAMVLFTTVMVGLGRILRGPTSADRMLAAQLFGTTGVAIILLLSHGLNQPALYDVALVFALLAGVAILTFVRRVWQPDKIERNHSHERD